MELADLAAQITSKSTIFISTADLERLLGAIKKTHNLWEIVDYSDFPVPAVFEAIRLLESGDFVSLTDSSVSLTEKGMELAKGVKPAEDLACPDCEGRGLDQNFFSDVRDRFLDIQKQRPAAVHRYDQGYVTPASTYSRFLIGYERGDIAGKDILILGDDDLISVVLGLSGLPKSITVVEIDTRLTDFIKTTGEREGFRVNVEEVDLRYPLSQDHRNSYDTFFTDPPETLVAADAFIGRGILALRSPGSAGYFGFTRREASLSKWYNLQRMLHQYGVVITDIIHNFNEYVNWDYEEETKAWEMAPIKVRPEKNWYRSALYRIETLEGFTGNTSVYADQNIHEDAESSTT